MTDTQIRFLKAIYNSEKTAKELCKELKIEPNPNDELGGYYNALNTAIDYLISDDGDEIDNMFRIQSDNSPFSNNDKYFITKEGKKYFEEYMCGNKNNLFHIESSSKSPYLKVKELIIRGEEIKNIEYHPAQGGFSISYVSGPKFDTWMGEINIFNERYLKIHPLHNSIHSTYFHYRKNPSSCDDMLGHLRALASDEVFFSNIPEQINYPASQRVKTVAQLLSEDILRCQQYLSNQENERLGRDLYIEITGRYDSIINGLGQGLYSYFPEQHFYDPDVEITTINHNLKLLLQKMISYQAKNYSSSYQERTVKQKTMSNKVFIVHGHDNAAKLEMARTLEKAGFEAIILHEQASAGKTVIEKIEANTNVAFAVVLYTPCDLGRTKEAKIDDERSRARQNVVFEHGYLIGKLGREKVCALVKDNIETPGDISGVVYIPMDDAGAWKMALAKEMTNAELKVDMNKFCS